jgi:hypothetical protein
MASPALYWTTRTVALAKQDILNGANVAMQNAGMTSIKVSSVDTAGRTPTVHSVVSPLHKKDPPSPGPGLGTTAPATYIVVFTSAGSGAKDTLAKLTAAWDDLNFL